MRKIRELGVARLGFQGGEPLLHPDIVELVRYAKSLGFYRVSMSTNGFLLTRELVADFERAGLDSLQISVDRMTPIAATKKSLKSVQHKLDWFDGSKIKLQRQRRALPRDAGRDRAGARRRASTRAWPCTRA